MNFLRRLFRRQPHTFRACITETEQMGNRLMRALTDRIDYLARKEGRR